MLTNLRPLRKQRGLSMKQLGEMVGVAEVTISTYENGRSDPSIPVLCKIADVLDVSLDMLVRGKEKDRPEGRSRDELLKMFDSMSEAELERFAALLTASLADRRFQAHLRQDGQ